MPHWPPGNKTACPNTFLVPRKWYNHCLAVHGYNTLWTNSTYQLLSCMWCYHLLYQSQPTKHLNGECITTWSAMFAHTNCFRNSNIHLLWNSNVHLNAQTFKGKINLRKQCFLINVHIHLQTCKMAWNELSVLRDATNVESFAGNSTS